MFYVDTFFFLYADKVQTLALVEVFEGVRVVEGLGVDVVLVIFFLYLHLYIIIHLWVIFFFEYKY
jgi:hypothetical protein